MKIGVPSGFIVIQRGCPCVLPVSVDVDRLEVMMSFYLRKTVNSTFAFLDWQVFALTVPGVPVQCDWEAVWRCPVCLCCADEAEASLLVKRAGGLQVIRHVEEEVQVLRGG